MKHTRLALAVGLVLVWQACAYKTTFLHISDIHLDPLYSPSYNATTRCRAPSALRQDDVLLLPPAHVHIPSSLSSIGGQYGRYGCDSPLSLVTAALSEMAKAKPAFMLFTGDLPAHYLDSASFLGALTKVPELILEYFPSTPFYPAIGNNDVLPAYIVGCADLNYATLWHSTWSRWLPGDQNETFLHMGAYAAPFAPGLTVLSLNTLLYSMRLPNGTFPSSDPCGQFAWLDAQLRLARAAKQAVYVIGHIPPGIDSLTLLPLWWDAYRATAMGILAAYSDVVAGMFFGHAHRDEFRVLSPKQALIVSSSISPMYNNNPSFKIFATDSTEAFAPLDAAVQYLDMYLANMRGSANFTLEYIFSETYGQKSMTAQALSQVISAMRNDTVLFDRFLELRQGLFLTEKMLAICVLASNDLPDLDGCLADYQVARTRRKL